MLIFVIGYKVCIFRVYNITLSFCRHIAFGNDRMDSHDICYWLVLQGVNLFQFRLKLDCCNVSFMWRPVLANFNSQDGHIICKDLPKGHTCVYVYQKWWLWIN